MNRKWATLGATMLAAVFAVAGLSVAQDEEAEAETEMNLTAIMEQVQKNNATVIRGIRNEAFYRRSKDDVAKASKELIELGKKAKPLTETIKDTDVVGGGDPIEKWNEVMDAYLKQAQEFSTVATKEETTSAEAKESYKSVSKACTACHEVFRIDETAF